MEEEGSVIIFGGYRDGILDERNMEWYSIKAPDPNAEADSEEKQKFESFSVLNFNNWSTFIESSDDSQTDFTPL